MKYPFEASAQELSSDLDAFSAILVSSLESEFLIMPKGDGFVEYATFREGYEALRQATKGFRILDSDRVFKAVQTCPIAFVVLRTMLGFTPPEWAYVSAQHTGMEIAQGAVRTLDRKLRQCQGRRMDFSTKTGERVRALVQTACHLLCQGVPELNPDELHRLGKADTTAGLDSLVSVSELGVPYPMLLYERFLGRPFAGHRDSVSEIVGDVLECKIEGELVAYGIPYRKTKRAEKLPGFDQAPDFVIPDEFNPKVVIEAKISEDDGTARDKVTRIQHLNSLSGIGLTNGKQKFDVIACISGRGFAVRREDMKKLLLATGGKVFTPHTLNKLVLCSSLRAFATKKPEN